MINYDEREHTTLHFRRLPDTQPRNVLLTTGANDVEQRIYTRPPVNVHMRTSVLPQATWLHVVGWDVSGRRIEVGSGPHSLPLCALLSCRKCSIVAAWHGDEHGDVKTSPASASGALNRYHNHPVDGADRVVHVVRIRDE